jgi:4-amino-4-deoxy-L-arabinose transferase-like glycosyltransferase
MSPKWLAGSAMKAVLLFALLFVFLGIVLIPYAGLQADEMIFAGPLQGANAGVFAIHLLHHAIPLMQMSYLGALKTLVYWPLFWIRPASIYAIRLPMVLAGAITIVIFYKWAGLIAGPRGALLAALLLATDPAFLLADTFDWGPVALQHLLVVSGCFLIARGRWSWGAFLFGLALWNKAIFAWTLAGLALAALLVFPAGVRAVLADRRRWTRALLAFALGALPLLYFNLKHPNSTLGDNTHFSVQNFPVKYQELKAAVDGSGLFGFVVAPDSEQNRREPQSPQGRAAAWISDRLGRHEKNLMPYAILVAVATVFLWWRSPGHRAAVFAAVCGGVTFLAMAATRNAGTSIHHTVLVWPMPQLLVGTVLGALPWRWLRVGLAALLIGSNLLVVNQYIVQFERNGSHGSFTDATNPLAESLVATSGESIHFIDWGICEPVHFLLRGRSNLSEAFPLLIEATPDPGQRSKIDAMIAAMIMDPNALFVDHTPALEEFHGVGAQLEEIARSDGYQRIPIRTVADRNGRAVFQVFRFQPAPADPPNAPASGPARPPHP